MLLKITGIYMFACARVIQFDTRSKVISNFLLQSHITIALFHVTAHNTGEYNANNLKLKRIVLNYTYRN